MFRRRGLDLISTFIRSTRIRSPRIDLLRRVGCPSIFEAHAPTVRSQQCYGDIYSSVFLSNGSEFASENSTDNERCSWFGSLGDLIRSPRIDLLRRVGFPSVFEAHARMAGRSHQCYREICSSVSLSNGKEFASENSTDSVRCSWFGRLADLIRSPRIDLFRRVGFPSVFEAHAWMAGRSHQCYREICSSVSLSNGKESASENSTDSQRCSSCGGLGDLIRCNKCREAFHAECLLLVPQPEGNWLYPNCVDKPGSSGDQTIFVCDQCEKKYKKHNIRCLKLTKTYELKGIAKGTWFCSDQCSEINASLETAVSDGAMTVGSLAMDIINTKRLEEKQTKRRKGKKHQKTANTKLVTDEAVAVHFRIVRGKGHNPRDNSLLSDACAIFHERFKEVKECGIDLIPVMVNGRKLNNFDFKGMYCVLLIVRSVTVSAALLRIVGTEVAQMPLVATRKEHDGKGYFQALYVCIEDFLFSLGVSEIILPASDKAETMWKKKFGFRNLKKKELIRYQKDFIFTIFKGSAMLKKDLTGAIILILPHIHHLES